MLGCFVKLRKLGQKPIKSATNQFVSILFAYAHIELLDVRRKITTAVYSYCKRLVNVTTPRISLIYKKKLSILYSLNTQGKVLVDYSCFLVDNKQIKGSYI